MTTHHTKPVIIADTSGLVSLLIPTDHNHEPAKEAADRLITTDTDILIPNAVFVEFLNILGRNVGHAAAAAAAAELQPPFLVLNEPIALHTGSAMKHFVQAPTAVSFTDCLVMALADEYGTREIFGFDKQFADAGYHRLTPSTQWEDAA